MSTGPFINVKKVYALNWPTFSVAAHLRLLSEQETTALGLKVEKQNLEALCADPKEGNPGILHDLVATITPSFMGLQGSFRVQARPESRLLPAVKAVGLKVYGEFIEAATSASNDLTESWTRIRRTRTGIREDNKAPIYSTQTDTVMLKLIRNAGDETGDTSATSATVIAQAGTLKVGDVLRGADTYVVITTPTLEGNFERAELRLG